MTAFTYTGTRFVAWLVEHGYDPKRLTLPEAWVLSMLYDLKRGAEDDEEGDSA